VKKGAFKKEERISNIQLAESKLKFLQESYWRTLQNKADWANEKSMIKAWVGLEMKELNPEDTFFILFEINEERRRGEIHTKHDGIVFEDVIKGILVKRMNEVLGGNIFKYGE
jgi:hypothetical protein